MQAPPFPVLYEDNHLLAIVKPPGIATMGVPRGDPASRRVHPGGSPSAAQGATGSASAAPTALEMARHYIKAKYQKPGNVYLGVVSRLDVPVSGVLLLARTSKAAARLSELFRTRAVEKTYWAVIEGHIEPPSGTLVDWLIHDERHRRMQTGEPPGPTGEPPGSTGEPPGLPRRPLQSGWPKQARLDYRVLSTNARRTLLEITLHTGRKHQIRVQFASRGHPILGDRKYKSQTTFPAGIALHARRLAFVHPVRHVPIELVAPLLPTWRNVGIPLPE